MANFRRTRQGIANRREMCELTHSIRLMLRERGYYILSTAETTDLSIEDKNVDNLRIEYLADKNVTQNGRTARKVYSFSLAIVENKPKLIGKLDADLSFLECFR